MTGDQSAMGRRIVFLGPSLPAAEARAIDPEVLVLPPAGMGDLLSGARRHRPVAVALIDGTFMQNMAVFHKEILQVLSEGIWVIGASSMGALRAAEMGVFGMIGVGHVHAGYADGSIVDDDEVALQHAGPEHDYRSLSDPMVNIRATLARAVDLGVLESRHADQLAAKQKARYFPSRSLRALLEDARSMRTIDASTLAALSDLIRAGGVDVKAADARMAIAEARTRGTGLMPPKERPQMVTSPALKATTERDIVVGQDDDLPVTFDRIRLHCVLNDNQYEDAWRAASSLAIIHRLARHLGVSADEADEAAAQSRINVQLRCSSDVLDQRLVELDMTRDEYDALVEVESVFIRLQRWLFSNSEYTRLTLPLINELRRSGRYETARREAGLFERLAAKSDANELRPSLRRLMGLQAAFTSWEVPNDLDDYIDRNLVGDRAQLYDRLMVSVVALHELVGFPLKGEGDDMVDVAAPPLNTRGGTA